MRWFRRRKDDAEEAPGQAAPPVEPATEPAASSGRSTAAEDEVKRPRRRGSRGGRGRKKKPAEATGAAVDDKPKAEKAKPAPKAAAEKKPRQRGGRSRRREPAKRIELPPVEKELFVSVEVGEQRVALLEDRKVAEVYLERRGRRSIAGNVYKGVVDNVLPGMEASFVDIGLPKNGFLYVDEIVVPELEGKQKGRRIQDLIQRGEQVLVQAVKDPMGTKGARLTTEVSLPGRFLVYVPYGEGIGISRRLEDSERERLKGISKELELPEGGIIVRTAAEGASKEELEGDFAFLQKLWATIKGRAERTQGPALVYQEAELPLRIIRDLFNREVKKVVVDHDRTYRRIVGYLKRTSPELTERVELYKQREPLMEKVGVEDAVRSTLNRRVDLPSGGYLIFDYAEAFTVVDVNTGRFVGSRSKTSGARLEDTITKNNLEAVEEVVRQLRLRDIGGIIVIDFIDMANPKNRQQVEDAFRRELERDRTKTYVVEISPLGLVEMTRQNVTDGPREILTNRCPVCQGDGIVVSAETYAIEAERRLRALTRETRHQAFRVELDEHVAALLVGSDGTRIGEIEEETGRRFFVETKPDLPAGHFEVLERGPVSKIAPTSLPVEKGQELELKLTARNEHRPADAIALLDGYVVNVAGGAGRVGRKAKIRIQRAGKQTAQAVLVDLRVAEPPVDPETALETDPAGDGATPPKKRTRRGSRGGRGRKNKPAAVSADTAVAEPEPDGEPVASAEPAAEAEPAAGDAASSPEQPKRKRTRRGSRGGRNRKKKTTAAAEATAEGEAVAEPEAAALEEEPKPDAAAEDEAPKPKKKTRRGSRGGRNRRRKRPAEAASEGQTGSVASVAGDGESG
ncbi:MAG TPA: Rne/Rng family ribonuclease [Gaiellaceae bacterium]